MEVVNASTTGTDVTVVLTAEMAPMRSAVCIHINFLSVVLKHLNPYYNYDKKLATLQQGGIISTMPVNHRIGLFVNSQGSLL